MATDSPNRSFNDFGLSKVNSGSRRRKPKTARSIRAMFLSPTRRRRPLGHNTQSRQGVKYGRYEKHLKQPARTVEGPSATINFKSPAPRTRRITNQRMRVLKAAPYVIGPLLVVIFVWAQRPNGAYIVCLAYLLCWGVLKIRQVRKKRCPVCDLSEPAESFCLSVYKPTSGGGTNRLPVSSGHRLFTKSAIPFRVTTHLLDVAAYRLIESACGQELYLRNSAHLF
jgi:hypothetical protein